MPERICAWHAHALSPRDARQIGRTAVVAAYRPWPLAVDVKMLIVGQSVSPRASQHRESGPLPKCPCFGDHCSTQRNEGLHGRGTERLKGLVLLFFKKKTLSLSVKLAENFRQCRSFARQRAAYVSVPIPSIDFLNAMALESAIALGSNASSSMTPQILRICMPILPAS